MLSHTILFIKKKKEKKDVGTFWRSKSYGCDIWQYIYDMKIYNIQSQKKEKIITCLVSHSQNQTQKW